MDNKAKQKAEELVEKFKEYAHRPQSYLCYADRDEQDWTNNAKQCAIIAVDEILEVAKKADSSMNAMQKSLFKREEWSHEYYWQSVKQQIQNLQ